MNSFEIGFDFQNWNSYLLLMNQTQNQVSVLVPYICETGIGTGTEIHASRKTKVSKIKDFINSNELCLEE
jgi:hypothetical protein